MIDCNIEAIVIKVAALGLDPTKHLGLRIDKLMPHLVKMVMRNIYYIYIFVIRYIYVCAITYIYIHIFIFARLTCYSNNGDSRNAFQTNIF